MKITDAAAQAVLQVMLKKGLNPKTTYLEVGVFNGNLGIGFTRDKGGKILRFGPLMVMVSNSVDSTGVVMDYGEIDGRKGLLFIGEDEHGRNDTGHQSPPANGEGSPRSEKGHGGAGLHN
jgi:hypothetical protein